MEYNIPTSYDSNEIYLIPIDANLNPEYISAEYSQGILQIQCISLIFGADGPSIFCRFKFFNLFIYLFFSWASFWFFFFLILSVLFKNLSPEKGIIKRQAIFSFFVLRFSYTLKTCHRATARWWFRSFFFQNTKAVVQICSVKKVFLTISQKSQENTYVRVFF